MYRVGICDDGKNMCASLEKMILGYAKQKNIIVETEVWYSGESLHNYLSQGNVLDILFLDIELIELSGIQVAEFIRNDLEDREMQIIYISGKAVYAQKLFKTQPMDFLVKPIEQEKIEETMELAIKIVGEKNTRFMFQRGRDYFYIPFADIICFSSQGREIKIDTKQGEYFFYGKLKDILKSLPKDFLLIHQSFVVNTKYVVKYSYETLELFDGSLLIISKANRKRVRQKLLSEGERIC